MYNRAQRLELMLHARISYRRHRTSELRGNRWRGRGGLNMFQSHWPEVLLLSRLLSLDLLRLLGLCLLRLDGKWRGLWSLLLRWLLL